MPAPKVRWLRVLAVAVPTAVAAVALIVYVADRIRAASLPAVGTAQSFGSPMMYPGLDRPTVVAAAAAAVGDGEQVIGVVVDGRARAYRVAGLSPMANHLVNDVIDGVPVSVSYCDRADCAQVFTGPVRDRPLGLWVGGWNGQMMLKSDAVFFWQPTGKMVDPARAEEQVVQTYPFERTTWGAWKDAHPDTAVYVGEADPAAGLSRRQNPHPPGTTDAP